MTRNPRWTRDELILALDLYMSEGRRWLPPSHPEVVRLSELLNKLPIYERSLRGAEFRNPHGVEMKLANFVSIDPENPRQGLRAAGELDRRIWKEFADDPERLRQTAQSISKSTLQISKKGDSNSFVASEDEEFREGRLLTRIHKRKERNRKAVERKKAKTRQDTGRLACEACGFDFAEHYGARGDGFAECHHKTPIFQLTENHRTRLEDLAIGCANCHRMIHREPAFSVEELRAIVEKNKR